MKNILLFIAVLGLLLSGCEPVDEKRLCSEYCDGEPLSSSFGDLYCTGGDSNISMIGTGWSGEAVNIHCDYQTKNDSDDGKIILNFHEVKP